MNPLNLVQENIEKTAKRQDGNYIKVDLAITYDDSKSQAEKLNQRLVDADHQLLIAQSKMEDAKTLLMKIEADGVVLENQIKVARGSLENEAGVNSGLPKIAAAFKEEANKMDTVFGQVADIVIASKKLRGSK